MKHFKCFVICSALLIPYLFSAPSIDTLEIDANSIVVSPEENQIIFSDNVMLNTAKFVLKSDSAIYNELDKTIILEGFPSTIDSMEGSKIFKGSANKIIFFNNTKIQLIGKAVMNYENINISSSSIVFNPENGKMASNE